VAVEVLEELVWVVSKAEELEYAQALNWDFDQLEESWRGTFHKRKQKVSSWRPTPNFSMFLARRAHMGDYLRAYPDTSLQRIYLQKH